MRVSYNTRWGYNAVSLYVLDAILLRRVRKFLDAVNFSRALGSICMRAVMYRYIYMRGKRTKKKRKGIYKEMKEEKNKKKKVK